MKGKKSNIKVTKISWRKKLADETPEKQVKMLYDIFDVLVPKHIVGPTLTSERNRKCTEGVELETEMLQSKVRWWVIQKGRSSGKGWHDLRFRAEEDYSGLCLRIEIRLKKTKKLLYLRPPLRWLGKFCPLDRVETLRFHK